MFRLAETTPPRDPRGIALLRRTHALSSGNHPMPRPKATEKRDRQVNVALTEREFNRLKESAAAVGLRRSGALAPKGVGAVTFVHVDFVRGRAEGDDDDAGGASVPMTCALVDG